MNKTAASIELAIVAGLLTLHAWTDSSAVLSKSMRSVVFAATVVGVSAVLLRRRPTLDEVGLRPRSWTFGVGTLVAGTTVAVVALFVIGAVRDTLLVHRDVGRWIASVWHLQILQQVLLNAFLAPRIAVLLGCDGFRGAAASAGVFAALHLPNPGLTFLSFFAAVGWREWFRRHPNLPAVWASHFLLSLAVVATQDPESIRRMRVGAAYLYFRG